MPFCRAIEANQNEVAKRLLEIEVNGTMSQKEKPTYETALIHACKLQNYDIIIKIMEISDNDLSIVDADERNIFHHAAKHDEVLSIIIGYFRVDLVCVDKNNNFGQGICFLSNLFFVLQQRISPEFTLCLLACNQLPR